MTETGHEVLEAVDAAFADYFCVMTVRSGGEVRRSSGLALWAGLHESPVIVNGAVRTDPGAPPTGDVLRTAEQFFHERGHRFTLTVRTHLDADLDEAATTAGYAPLFELELMVCEEPPPPVQDLDVRPVESADDVAAYERVSAEAYGIPELTATVFARPESLLAPNTKAFLGYGDGAPVAAALAHLTGDIGGIYWVGTVQAARRRGLGRAVSAAATRAGFELGARLMKLESTPMAVSVYRSLGYREVGHYRLLTPSSA